MKYSWVYVIKLRSKDRYYIGATRNLLKRIGEHRRGQMPYTNKHGFQYVQEVYWCNTYNDALRLEQYLWNQYNKAKWKPPELRTKEQVEYILKNIPKTISMNRKQLQPEDFDYEI